MNISDEAVDAAAKATFEHANVGSPWDDAGTFWKDAYRASVLAGIEAAAPYMLAAVWLEGYAAGEIDGAYGTNGHEPPNERNPYGLNAGTGCEAPCPLCPRVHKPSEPCVESTPFPRPLSETYDPTSNHSRPPDRVGEWFYACEGCSGLPDGDRQ